MATDTQQFVFVRTFGLAPQEGHGPIVTVDAEAMSISFPAAIDGYFADDSMPIIDANDEYVIRGEKEAHDVADLVYRFLMAKAVDRTSLRLPL